MSNKTPKDASAKTVSARKSVRKYLRSIPLIVLAGYVAGTMLAVSALWLFLRYDKAAAPAQNVARCNTNPELERITVSSGETMLITEVAETSRQKYKGLSDRNCLEANHAMLFPYETEGDYCFVMRDMNFPIDMLWLDSAKRVVNVKHDARPENYPAESYCPDSPAQYVLEVTSGLSKQRGWAAGTQFSF